MKLRLFSPLGHQAPSIHICSSLANAEWGGGFFFAKILDSVIFMHPFQLRIFCDDSR